VPWKITYSSRARRHCPGGIAGVLSGLSAPCFPGGRGLYGKLNGRNFSTRRSGGRATGNYLLSPTPEAIILAVNDAFLATASRAREELLGLSVFAAFPENPDDPQDTGVSALRDSILRVLASGKPDALPLQRYPIWVTTPEGGKRYEERFWSALNTPVFGPGGELICISHHTTDVTKQTLAEAALRRTEARYRSLFESIDQGFCIVEILFDQNDEVTDYRFCEVNPMFEAQTGLIDPVGKTMRKLVPQHEAHWFAMYGKIARTGEPLRFENEAKGLNRWYDGYAFRVDDSNAHKVAILFKEITDKKRAEEALRNSERQALEAARRATAERHRLDAVLEAVPIGIVVSDATGAIVLANHAFKRHWGEAHPLPKETEDFRRWKGRWADDTERQGKRLQPRD
jgi:PAS domain S-box-containing protein